MDGIARSMVGGFANGVIAEIGTATTAARPAIERSVTSLFSGITRTGAGILLEQAGSVQAMINSAIRPAPTAMLNPAIAGAQPTNKTYQLNMNAQQSTGSIVRDFKMMETFSL
jgi:hypothetical protein